MSKQAESRLQTVVKRNVEPFGVKAWSKYLGNCSVVMLYTTKQRPFGADPIVIFGQFPEKGAEKAKGEGYVLYHCDTFWEISMGNLINKF